MLKTKVKTWIEILLTSTKLGLTSFGGPIAHLGYFRDEYVQRRKWLDEKKYADLVALSQFLPGPSSSQVGIGVGVMRGGMLGGIFSFIGFTLPSVIALIIFALLLDVFNFEGAGWIHGLKIVAVVIVAHAILGMAQNLAPDNKRKVLVLFAIVTTLIWQVQFAQITVILIAGIIGFLLYRQETITEKTTEETVSISHRIGYVCLTIFFLLLVSLPVLREISSSGWIALFDGLYRSGALVFGGGHVVLPLLEQEFVRAGWLTNEQFLAGYGATQAVPGPLFTFAAYIGTVIYGWQGGLFATFAIFLPAFLLIVGALPFWNTLRKNVHIRGALMGVNAAVVGILIAAFYDPIWTSSILSPVDFSLAVILFFMFVFGKLPPWVIVLTGAIGGMVIAYL